MEIVKFAVLYVVKVSKGAKIRNRYNQVPHLTQDTNGKVTNSRTLNMKKYVPWVDLAAEGYGNAMRMSVVRIKRASVRPSRTIVHNISCIDITGSY